MENLIYWIGAILMVIAPLFEIKTWIIIIIIGLIVLTHQAFNNQLYNLVFLNICSIYVYGYRYHTEQIKEKIRL